MTDFPIAAKSNVSPFQVTVPLSLCFAPKYTPEVYFTDKYVSQIQNSRDHTIKVIARQSGTKFEVLYGWHHLMVLSAIDQGMSVTLDVYDYDDQEAVACCIGRYGLHFNCHDMRIARALAIARKELKVRNTTLAKAMEMKQSTFNNLIRLANLDDDVATAFITNEINMGTAKLLCSCSAARQRALLAQYREQCWGYWDIYYFLNPDKKKATANDKSKQTDDERLQTRDENDQAKDAEVIRLQETLSRTIGAPTLVDSVKGEKGGVLMMKYHSYGELENIITHTSKIDDSKISQFAVKGVIAIPYPDLDALDDLICPILGISQEKYEEY